MKNDGAKTVFRAALSWLFCMACVCAVGAGAANGADAGSAGHAVSAGRLNRARFIGVWRLSRIDYSGPGGSTVDPFYQTGSTGLLIYDSSGWMSVRIAAPDRRSFDVPVRRPAPDESASLEAAKASAFDGYYAYDGTWDFDARASELVHHVVSSLLSAENGKTYRQKVSFEGGRLIFSNRSGPPGGQTVRRKIWERVGGR